MRSQPSCWGLKSTTQIPWRVVTVIHRAEKLHVYVDSFIAIWKKYFLPFRDRAVWTRILKLIVLYVRVVIVSLCVLLLTYLTPQAREENVKIIRYIPSLTLSVPLANGITMCVEFSSKIKLSNNRPTTPYTPPIPSPPSPIQERAQRPPPPPPPPPPVCLFCLVLFCFVALRKLIWIIENRSKSNTHHPN